MITPKVNVIAMETGFVEVNCDNTIVLLLLDIVDELQVNFTGAVQTPQGIVNMGLFANNIIQHHEQSGGIEFGDKTVGVYTELSQNAIIGVYKYLLPLVRLEIDICL